MDWENNFEPDEDDVEKKKENAGYNICDVLGENSPHILQIRNYSGMLIGCPIAILYFLARKITAEGAEER
ncbi:MAG: hypothetical protein U9N36_09205 [Euryarchaeota archaeon]|nr:hypothetical protein [Euryarchaeota archaeon]